MPENDNVTNFDSYLNQLTKRFVSKAKRRLDSMQARADLSENEQEYYNTMRDLVGKFGESVGNEAQTEAVKSAVDMTKETRATNDDAVRAGSSDNGGDNKKPQDRGTPYNETANSAEGSNAFGNYLTSRFGVAKAPNSDRLNEQADLHDKQGAEERSNAQWHSGESKRNYRNEAEKTAVSQAHAKNDQLVAESEAVDAASALANRQIGQADYNGARDYMATQRTEAEKNAREAYGAQQTAIEERAASDAENYNYNNMNLYNTASDVLSKGGGVVQATQQQSNTARQTPPAQPTNTGASDTIEEAEGEEPPSIQGSAQTLMNYVQGVRSDEWLEAYTQPDVQKAIQYYGLTQASGPEDPKHYTHGTDADRAVAAEYSKFMEDYNNATGRMVGTDQQVNMNNERELKELYNKDISSDARQKNILRALGSIRY